MRHILLVGLATLALAACGDDGNGETGAGGTTAGETAGATEGDGGTGTTEDDATTTGGDADETDAADGEVEGGDDAGETTGPEQPTWVQDELNLDEEFVLRGVWGPSETDLIAVGNKSTIIEYHDGKWELVHQNSELDTLNGVWGTSFNNAWAVGAHGAILHRDESGWDIGTGCTNDAACEDGDPCTVATCGPDGSCQYAGSGQAGCCGTVAYSTNWDSGTLESWTVIDIASPPTGMIWNVANNVSPAGEPRATSGQYALYFGEPTQLNFDNGMIVASAATSPSISLPDATAVNASFQVFVDTESGATYDILELQLVQGALTNTIWTKQDVGGTTGQQFVSATADLSAWAGQKVQLRFMFNSSDPIANNGEGVYVDDFKLDTECGEATTGATFPTLWDVWGASPDNVWAVGNQGTILHYDGESWKRQAGGDANDLFGVGLSENTVAAGGAEGEVFANFGAGLSVDKASASTIRDVAMLSDSEAIAVGDNGTLVRHTSAGWNPESSPASGNLNGVWTDGVATVAVGAVGAIVRQDGGGPWMLQPTGQFTELYGIWGQNADNLVAVGDKGLLMKYAGGQWTKEGNLTSSELRSIIGFGADGPYVAVGGGGTIARTTEGVWGQDKSPTTFVLHGVWGASENQVWAVGNLGTIIRYDGTAWKAFESPTGLTLYDVAGRNANEAFAVGQNGVMLQWDGVEWAVLRSNTTANLRAVWGFDATDVYAVGAQATIMHFNGLNWSQLKVEDEVHGDTAQPVINQLYDVWGPSKKEVYAVGADGTIIMREIDAMTGQPQWVKVPQQDNDITVRGMVGLDAENMWMVGREGLVLHYTGMAGQALTTEDTLSISTLYDVIRFKNGSMVAVGDLGTVLRRMLFAE